MFKLRILKTLLAALAVAVLLVTMFSCGNGASLSFEAAKYVNIEYGFSIEYPAEYMQKSPSGQGGVFRATSPDELTILKAQVVYVEEGTTFADLEAVTKANLSLLGATDVSIASQKETTLEDGSTPAYELVYEWSHVGHYFRTLQLSVIKGNNWFSVTLTTTTDQWPDDEAELMEIAYTLQFRESTARPTVPAGEWSSTRIPMRDGKYLAASVYLPSKPGKYPTIFIQTPYDKSWYVTSPSSLPCGSTDYAYVAADRRGYYASRGAGRAWSRAGIDGYDAVEWIAKQDWSNGKVGTWGASALAGAQYLTAIKKPPHLVCAVPIVLNLRYDYLEYYPGGAYREHHSDAASLAIAMPTQSPATYRPGGLWVEPGVPARRAKSIDIPMLFISGWYDFGTLHDGFGVIQSYIDVQTHGGPNARGEQRLLMGPWTHAWVGHLQQGELQYPDAENVAHGEAKRFFDYWLRGIDDSYTDMLPIRYFQMGANRWLETETWPPPDATEKVLYLQAGGRLTSDIPTSSATPDQLRYDPANPNPTVGGAELSWPLSLGEWGPRDQSPLVESRDDALVYTTDILESNFTLAGSTQVQLYVSSNRLDTDFAVRLCDVYPDGRSMLVCDGIRRMRFRESYSEETLMVPGEVYHVTIDLPNTAMTFLKGHRIRISVTSSNYPRFDLNPNNGGPLYQGGESLVATNSIYHDAEHPSAIIFMPYTP